MEIKSAEKMFEDFYNNRNYRTSPRMDDTYLKKEIAIKFAKSYAEQYLKLAAERAEIDMNKKSQYGKSRKWQKCKEGEEVDLFSYEVKYFVNKDSILDIIKELK